VAFVSHKATGLGRQVIAGSRYSKLHLVVVSKLGFFYADLKARVLMD
jgi:hypothetical protein